MLILISFSCRPFLYSFLYSRFFYLSSEVSFSYSFLYTHDFSVYPQGFEQTFSFSYSFLYTHDFSVFRQGFEQTFSFPNIHDFFCLPSEV